MAGKTIIVTGATRGLGKLVAMGAAAMGERVILTYRDEARGKAALADVAAASANAAIAAKAADKASAHAAAIQGHAAGKKAASEAAEAAPSTEAAPLIAAGPRPELLRLDLASLASVRAAAAEARERFPRVDVLVNNAGTFSRNYAETAEGVELTMCTNYLGPFLFTRLLLPNMDTGSRIVNLTSAVFTMGNVRLGKPAGSGPWGGFMNYAASKRALLLFSLDLAETLRPRGISVNALHPGVVRTEIMRMRTWYGPIVDLILAPFYGPPDAGVDAAIRLALSPELEGATGGYYDRNRLAAVPARFLDPAVAEELLRESLRLVGESPRTEPPARA